MQSSAADGSEKKLHFALAILMIIVLLSALAEHRNREIYADLELSRWPKPSWGTVQKRYRELALKYHPDRAGGDADRMRRLNEAYKKLRPRQK